MIPVAWMGRVAGVSPQLQGLPAIRVQVFSMPATHQPEGLSLSRLNEVYGQVDCALRLGQLGYGMLSCAM